MNCGVKWFTICIYTWSQGRKFISSPHSIQIFLRFLCNFLSLWYHHYYVFSVFFSISNILLLLFSFSWCFVVRWKNCSLNSFGLVFNGSLICFSVCTSFLLLFLLFLLFCCCYCCCCCSCIVLVIVPIMKVFPFLFVHASLHAIATYFPMTLFYKCLRVCVSCT